MTLHGTHLVVALGLLCELGHVNILLAAVVGHCDLLMMVAPGFRSDPKVPASNLNSLMEKQNSTPAKGH
jgi:hypothetical protein